MQQKRYILRSKLNSYKISPMRFYKTTLSTILCLILSVSIFGQQKKEFTDVSENTTEKKVHWLTINEALAKNNVEKRKIVIDVYTDWCGWCKVLDSKTFSNDYVAKVLNEDFYPVKFNAEQKEDLEFLGNTYKYMPENKVNEFAVALLNGKMGYPKVVFLEVTPGEQPKANILYIVGGFVEAKEFHQIANYFGSDLYLTTDWEKYSADYVSPIE